MTRRATGQIIEKETANGTAFALRFRAYGERRYSAPRLRGGRLDAGSAPSSELNHVLADVERGIWVNRRWIARPTHLTSPTFHEFASEWLEAARPGAARVTVLDYSWQLSNHLLPFFHRHRLPQITVGEVDRYRDFKVREGALSAESINKTITRLGQILAVAEERDLITRNPVRVNTPQPQAQGTRAGARSTSTTPSRSSRSSTPRRPSTPTRRPRPRGAAP